MVRTNKNQQPQYYTGYLIKRTTNVQYQNRAVYEEATNPTNADLYNLFELNPINNEYMRTEDTAVNTGKTYYIQTWEVIPGNESVLAEDKVVNKNTERYRFKFGYLDSNANLERVQDVANYVEQDKFFYIFTDDNIPVSRSDSVEIDDEVYAVIDCYMTGHSDTNMPLKKAKLTTFIGLKGG